MPSVRQWTLAATILASSMTFIDGTVVNVALPALQADLHATITEVQWVVEAYALFLGASILAGIATSARALITARALQGIGAAFLVPGSLAIISATFDDADRGRAIGTWSGFTAITTAIGPVMGGWLIEHVSWRAVFFLNVPLAVPGLGGAVFGLLEWPPLGASHPLVLGAPPIGMLSLFPPLIVERPVPSN